MTKEELVSISRHLDECYSLCFYIRCKDRTQARFLTCLRLWIVVTSYKIPSLPYLYVSFAACLAVSADKLHVSRQQTKACVLQYVISACTLMRKPCSLQWPQASVINLFSCMWRPHMVQCNIANMRPIKWKIHITQTGIFLYFNWSTSMRNPGSKQLWFNVSTWNNKSKQLEHESFCSDLSNIMWEIQEQLSFRKILGS